MNSITEQALVFIGSAILLVPLFQKFRFGSVLGYLIAGIVVGPFGLALIQDSESVMHFAELGVIFLLFVIGLEIQPSKLWSMRKHLLGLGGVQILLSTAIFSGIGILFHLEPTTAIVLGFALSLSSTAFAIQTLVERNEFNTDFGRSSFSILLMQDLTAIPALAIIPVLAAKVESTSGAGGGMGKAIFAIPAIIVLVVVSKYLFRPIFRAIAATRTREIFTAMTLFIVLGVSALMQKIGLSAALGTFVAGVLLADSEYRHEIETNLEPFKSLLMGLFFIAIGMSVSVDLVIAQPLLIFGLALGYSLIKALVIYGSGRLFKLNHEKSKMMALTIAQGGEFAFVIFGIALQSQIAQSETINILTAMITISMALSPAFRMISDQINARHCKNQNPRDFDTFEGEEPQIIIAGYGRFGQMFGRVLKAQNIAHVAIDHDPEHVELVRKFGTKIYYGDASREDLLESAGAARAKYFILAIDDVEESLQAAKTVKEHFPNLTIFARARNRGHAFDLKDLGITHIKRETFDSSVLFIGDLLVEMGFGEERSADLIERFRVHDEIMLEEQYKVRNDDKMFISVAKQGTAQLAQVLNDDSTKTYIDSSAEENSAMTLPN